METQQRVKAINFKLPLAREMKDKESGIDWDAYSSSLK